MSEDEAIREYIEQYHMRYTRKAITKILLKRGYALEDIDREWDAFLSRPNVPTKHVEHTKTRHTKVGSTGLNLVLVIFYLLWLLANLLTNKSSINMLFFVVQVVLLIVAFLLQFTRMSRANIGLLIVVVNVLWLLIISGSCPNA